MSEGKAFNSCRLIEIAFAHKYVEVSSSCALHIVLPEKVLEYLIGW